MAAAKAVCRRHPREAAGWWCTDCGAPLCADCTSVRRFHVVDLLVCCLCRGRAEVLRLPRSNRPLSEYLAGIWTYPLTKEVLPSLLGTALWLTLFVGVANLILRGLSLFEVFWAMVPGVVINFTYAVGLSCSWMMGIIRRTAATNESAEFFEFSDLWRDVLRPAWLAIAGLSWIWIPAVGRVVTLGELSLHDSASLALIGVFVAYAPVVLLIAAAGGTTFDVFFPLRVVSGMVALGTGYLRVLAVVLLVTGPMVLFQSLAAKAWLVIPLLGPWLVQALALYPLAVIARALGFLLRVHGDRLHYGHAADYLEPALPGIEPRGAA